MRRLIIVLFVISHHTANCINHLIFDCNATTSLVFPTLQQSGLRVCVKYIDGAYQVSMDLQKEVDEKEKQYGALTFNGETAKMSQGMEVWFIGDLSTACKDDEDACTPGIWFLEVKQYSQPDPILDPSDPGGKKFLRPDVVECETTANAHRCVFLRKLSYSAISGFQPLNATNSETFQWRQVWKNKRFGDIGYHGSNKGPKGRENFVGVNLRSTGTLPPTPPPTAAPTPPPTKAKSADCEPSDWLIIETRETSGLALCIRFVEDKAAYEIKMRLDEGKQYGAIGLNKVDSMVGLEIWFLGKYGGTGEPRVSFLQAKSYLKSEVTTIAAKPAPDVMECNSVGGEVTCTFLRKIADSDLDGFVELTASNSKTFWMEQAFRDGSIGDVQFHGSSNKGLVGDGKFDFTLTGYTRPSPPPSPHRHRPRSGATNFPLCYWALPALCGLHLYFS